MSCALNYFVSFCVFPFVAPCKGIQDSLGFWIPDHRLLSLELGFRIPVVSGIPDSLICIADYKVQDSGFQKQKYPGCRIPLNEERATLGGVSKNSKTTM